MGGVDRAGNEGQPQAQQEITLSLSATTLGLTVHRYGEYSLEFWVFAEVASLFVFRVTVHNGSVLLDLQTFVCIALLRAQIW